MFGREEVEGDGSGVVGLEELLLFAAEDGFRGDGVLRCSMALTCEAGIMLL